MIGIDASPATLTPRERAESFAAAFRGQANHIAFAYGSPVYLVGSYLTAGWCPNLGGVLI